MLSRRGIERVSIAFMVTESDCVPSISVEEEILSKAGRLWEIQFLILDHFGSDGDPIVAVSASRLNVSAVKRMIEII